MLMPNRSTPCASDGAHLCTRAPGTSDRRRTWTRVAVALAASTACATLGPGDAAPFPAPVQDVVAANVALGDPYEGRFPFEEAVAGLPGSGALRATLVTDEGKVECELDPRHAPLTVASFVGLARGLRPFRAE